MRKKKYIGDEEFAELRLSVEQALQHARGERNDLRTTVLPVPPRPMKKQEIIKLRQALNYSQALFARALNVSLKTVQAWEAGAREPKDAALKLLTIAQAHPEVLGPAVFHETNGK